MKQDALEIARDMAKHSAVRRTLTSPEDGRCVTLRALDGYGIPGDRNCDIVLLVGELTGNAFRHGKPPVSLDLELSRARGMLVVRVYDGDTRSKPCPRNPQHDELCGRGLMIVSKIADSWGYQTASERKCVWAEISIFT